MMMMMMMMMMRTILSRGPVPTNSETLVADDCCSCRENKIKKIETATSAKRVKSEEFSRKQTRKEYFVLDTKIKQKG